MCAVQGEAAVKAPLEVDSKVWLMTCVSMGNPHAITFGTTDGETVKVKPPPFWCTSPNQPIMLQYSICVWLNPCPYYILTAHRPFPQILVVIFVASRTLSCHHKQWCIARTVLPLKCSLAFEFLPIWQSICLPSHGLSCDLLESSFASVVLFGSPIIVFKLVMHFRCSNRRLLCR